LHLDTSLPRWPLAWLVLTDQSNRTFLFDSGCRAFPDLAANLTSGMNKGYYTWDNIRTLVNEARLRGIRVIPEYVVCVCVCVAWASVVRAASACLARIKPH
jgi:hypothetical protein